MATTAAPPSPAAGMGGLMRKVTKKLKAAVDGDAETSIRPSRAGTLRSKAREQMRTGKGADDFQFGDPHAGRKSLEIGADGYGTDGKLYIKNLDENPPPPSQHASSSSSPPTSTIRPVTHQREPPNPSPHSLAYNPPPISRPLNDANSHNHTSDAHRSTPRRPSEPSDAFARPRAPPSPPQQGRARSQSQSQPNSSSSRPRFEGAPPLPGRGGVALTESYAPVSSSGIPRSQSGPNQRASTSGEYTRSAGGAAGGGEEGAGGGWGKMKRSMTIGRKRAESRAQEAAARDPNRPPSPPRVAAAPKMYSAAQLAMEMDRKAQEVAAQEAAAYRQSMMTMGKITKAAEAKEESRLTEAAFY